MKKAIVLILLFAVLAVSLFAQNNSGPVKTEMLPEFKSDGCSWFPDGNYRDCCVIHDEAYFFGGSWKKRLSADNKLFKCVVKKGGWYQPLIAPLMWTGVRAFGVSFLPTSFRWGFGKKKPAKRTKSKETAKPKDSK